MSNESLSHRFNNDHHSITSNHKTGYTPSILTKTENTGSRQKNITFNLLLLNLKSDKTISAPEVKTQIIHKTFLFHHKLSENYMVPFYKTQFNSFK